MEPDQIDPAFHSFKKPDQSVSMTLGIVQSGEHGVFETHPPLASEVIFPDQVHHLLNGPSLLDRHYRNPLLWERIMETDSQMAACLVKIAPEIRQDPNSGKGDPFGAPTESPISRKDLNGIFHIDVIIKRFPHAHKDGVGEIRGLIDGYELRQDHSDGEIAMEALPPGHAELTSHPATGL